MEIRKEKQGDRLIVSIFGRLDTVTAPALETELRTSINGVTYLELNLENLEYISSAGLRVILMAQKVMNKQGQMVVKHPNEMVMEIFEVTGFADILEIEE